GVFGAGILRIELRATDSLAEVFPELTLRRHEQHQSVCGAVVLIAHSLGHAVVADRAACTLAVAVVAGHLLFRALVRFVALDAVPVEGRGRIALRHLEAATASTGASTNDRRANAQGRVEWAGVDADGCVARDRGEAVGVDHRTRHAGPGIVGDPVTGHVLV